MCEESGGRRAAVRAVRAAQQAGRRVHPPDVCVDRLIKLFCVYPAAGLLASQCSCEASCEGTKEV